MKDNQHTFSTSRPPFFHTHIRPHTPHTHAQTRTRTHTHTHTHTHTLFLLTLRMRVACLWMRVIRPFACLFFVFELLPFQIWFNFLCKRKPWFHLLNLVIPVMCLSFLCIFVYALPPESGRGWVSLSPPWLPSSCWWHLSASAFPVPQSTSAISVRPFGWRQNMCVCVTVTFTFEKEFVVVVVVDRLLLKPPRRSTGRRDGNKRKLRSMFVLQNPHWFYFQFRVRLSSATINGTVCRKDRQVSQLA